LKQTFYSNGKLLLTGEYTVLDGAKALALPTRFGQYLHIEEGTGNVIKWASRNLDGSIWLDLEIPFSAIIGKDTKGTPEHKTLVEILHEAHKLNPDILNNSTGIIATTELTFPRFWGLGTSSTLINNVAQWFAVDAFELLKKSFGGSGYDIACAQHDTPIIYCLQGSTPLVERVVYDPIFKSKLYFVYLNQKQNSRSAILAYKEKRSDIKYTIVKISDLSLQILSANDLLSFQAALEEHEKIMSAVLHTPTVKEALFPDFPGTIKSLGAWGGDFVLVCADQEPSNYFKNLGYETIIPSDDMILK